MSAFFSSKLSFNLNIRAISVPSFFKLLLMGLSLLLIDSQFPEDKDCVVCSSVSSVLGRYWAYDAGKIVGL